MPRGLTISMLLSLRLGAIERLLRLLPPREKIENGNNAVTERKAEERYRVLSDKISTLERK